MNYLELAKVKAFYYAKAIEFDGDFEKANKCIQFYNLLGNQYQDFNHPSELRFNTDLDYRIKPETVRHPGGEMPKPLSTEEAKAGFVYVPTINSKGVSYIAYANLSINIEYAKLGHAYATRQDAIDAGHVMFNIPKGE
jgi:hypothetical protein